METWLCRKVEDIEERVLRMELALDRTGIRLGAGARLVGSNWEVSEYQIAQWVPGTTLPLGPTSEYVRMVDGNLEIRGGAMDIHTAETGARMTLTGEAMKAYDADDAETLNIDFRTGSVTMVGTITATTGSIGGWDIGPSALSKNNVTLDSAGRLVLGTGNDVVVASAADPTYGLWAGHATPASAPFSVTKGGALYAKSGGFGGTPEAPVVVLDSASAKVFVPQPIYLGSDDTGLVVGGSVGGVTYIQSSNYQQGSAGWRILNDGNAEFNNVVARGSVITDYISLTDEGGLTFTAEAQRQERSSITFNDSEGVLLGYIVASDTTAPLTGFAMGACREENPNDAKLLSQSSPGYEATGHIGGWSGNVWGGLEWVVKSDLATPSTVQVEAASIQLRMQGDGGNVGWYNKGGVSVATMAQDGTLSLGGVTATGEVRAEHLHSTDDLETADDATIGGELVVNGNYLKLQGADNANKYLMMQDYANDGYTTMYASAAAFHFDLPPKGHSQMRIYSKQDGATDEVLHLESDYSGMWNNFGNWLANGTIQYKGTLQPYRNGGYVDSYTFVPYTTKKASTSWDGDAKSATNNGTIDLSAVFGVPAGVKAVLCRVLISDDAAGSVMTVGSSSTQTPLCVRTQAANVYIENMGPVPCDANGDVSVTFSTAISAVYLEIYGYWI